MELFRRAAPALLAVLLALGAAQATRPGPMLRGATTVIVFQQQPLTQMVADASISLVEDAGLDILEDGSVNLGGDAVVARAFDDLRSSVVVRPSWFDQQPDVLFDLTSPSLHHGRRRKRCRHSHRRHVNERRGYPPVFPRLDLEVSANTHEGIVEASEAVSQDNGAVTLGRTWTIGNPAIQQGQYLARDYMKRDAKPLFRGGAAVAASAGAAVQSWEQEPARPCPCPRSIPQRCRGDQRLKCRKVWDECEQLFNKFKHTAKSLKKCGIDIKEAVETKEWAPAKRMEWVTTHHVERMRKPCVFKRLLRRIKRWKNRHSEVEVTLALMFVLLSVACATVWARLLITWCRCARRDGPSRHRRRLLHHWTLLRCILLGQTFPEGEGGKPGVEQPLLAPLGPEPADIAAAGKASKVESAAAEARSAPQPVVNYITLQYQPLSSESR